MEGLFLEHNTVKAAGVPADLIGSALTGARVGLAKSDKIAIKVACGDSATGVLAISFEQHTAASGGSSKALSFDNKYYYKAGAATSFTQVEPTAAASTYTLTSTFAAAEGIIVFEIFGEDLDVNGGYNHISVNVADTVDNKIVYAEYILHDMRFKPAYAEVV